MKKRWKIYLPIRFMIGVKSILVFLLCIGNILLIERRGSLLLYIPLVALVCIFIYFFMPVLKNQRIMLSGRKLILFTFGRENYIDIVKNLYEVVVLDDEIRSYRFSVGGKRFQISPLSYYEDKELAAAFKRILKRNNVIVPVVIK